MGAIAFGQFSTILIQMATLPLFLTRWSMEEYGVWLLLVAFSGYFSLADFGLVSAANNAITMKMANLDKDGALNIFQTTIGLECIIFSLLILLCSLVLLLAPLPGLDNNLRRLALWLLILSVMLGAFHGLAEAILTAIGRYSMGVYLSTGTRIAEWMGSAIALFMFGDLVSVAAGTLIGKIVGLLIALFTSYKIAYALPWGVTKGSIKTAIYLFKPGLTFLAFPIGSAINIQGFSLLVGSMLGPSAAVIFTAYRTLSRLTVQSTSMLSTAMAPEFARLAGTGRIDRLDKAYSYASKVSAGLAIAVGFAAYIAMPLLLKYWTHGRIEFLPLFAACMTLYGVATGLWHVPRVVLQSRNKHSSLAFVVIGMSLVSIPVGMFLMRRYGLEGSSFALLLTEALTMLTAAHLAKVTILH